MEQVIKVEEGNTKKEVTKITSELNLFKINGLEDYSKAERYVKDITVLEKKIKEFFKDSKKKAQELHKTIIAMEKEQLLPLSELKSKIKFEISEYIKIENKKQKAIADYVYAQSLAKELNPVDVENFVSLKTRAFECIAYFSKETSVLDLDNIDVFSNEVSSNLNVLNRVNFEIRAGKELELKEKAERARATGQEEIAEIIENQKVEEIKIEKRKLPKSGMKKLSTFYTIKNVDKEKLAKAILMGIGSIDFFDINETVVKNYLKQFDDDKALHFAESVGIELNIDKRVR